jgi:hypothetical protein
MFTALILAAAVTTYSTADAGCVEVNAAPAPNVAYQQGEGIPTEINPSALTPEDFREVPIPLNIPLKNYPARQVDANAADSSPQNPDLSNAWVQPGFLSVDTQTGETRMNGKSLNAPLTDCLLGLEK